jgi:hypothetical protein
MESAAGSPVAYWLSPCVPKEVFTNRLFGEFATLKDTAPRNQIGI